MGTNTRQYESYQQSFHSAYPIFRRGRQLHICDDYGILFGLHFIGKFAILPIIGSLGLFLFFSKMNITSTIINLLAQSAFAVYLISENPNVYPWFWKLVFDNIDYFNTPYMIGVALLQCAIVFVTCITIDMLYKRLQKLIEFRHR